MNGSVNNMTNGDLIQENRYSQLNIMVTDSRIKVKIPFNNYGRYHIYY